MRGGEAVGEPHNPVAPRFYGMAHRCSGEPSSVTLGSRCDDYPRPVKTLLPLAPLLAALAACAQPAPPPPPAPPTALAASSSGVLHDVTLSAAGSDVALGQLRFAGGTPRSVTDLARCPDGTLYAVDSFSLYTLDRSAVLTLVGATGLEGVEGETVALACDAAGALWAGAAFSLHRLSRETGKATLVGATGAPAFSGDLAFAPDGRLYGTVMTSDVGDALAVFDTTSGAGAVIGDTGFSPVYGLAFAGGRLFGLTGGRQGQLLDLDPVTGKGTVLRPLSFSAYGAANERP